VATDRIRHSNGLALTYKSLMLLKNRKLLIIWKRLAGIAMHNVPMNILLARIVKNGLIFIHEMKLCAIVERYNRAAVDDRYQPYPSKLIKQNVPCDMASKSCRRISAH
jgi:hypothetical protein